MAAAEAAGAQPGEASTAELAARILTMRDEADLDFVLEEVPSAIAQSRDGLERVTKIVKSMKDFSHPGSESTTTPRRQQRAGLDQGPSTTSEWKYVADLEIEPAEDLPTIRCFAGELNQVLVNLIVNAAHAIADRQAGEPGHRGRITVGTRRQGDRAEIRVSDNGSGIPDDVRARIFDPFFTTKDVGKGTGQGLALVHGVVVNKHGGSVRVDSTVGSGTTFTLDLPIDGPAEPDGEVEG